METKPLIWGNPNFKPKHSFIPDCDKTRFVLDIETLAVDPKAAIVDIALVEVAGRERTLSVQIRPSWYEDHGLGFVRNAETVKFHAKNNPSFLLNCEAVGHTAEYAVGLIFDFLSTIQEAEETEVLLYMQGTDFDKPILANLFQHFDVPFPVHYRNVRDLRTLNALTPEVKYVAGNHSALDDAYHSKDHLLKQAACDPFMFKYVWGFAA